MQLENRTCRSSLIKKTLVTMKEQNHYIELTCIPIGYPVIRFRFRQCQKIWIE